MLSGKGAVVTGGARGIGFAIAQELISQGAKVVICSRTESEVQNTLKILNKKSQFAFGIVCDVSRLIDCKKLKIRKKLSH